MSIEPTSATRTRLRFPAWQRAYEATLEATDRNALFKLVEIAESALLVRRDLLKATSKDKAEQHAIEEALRVLAVIKEGQLMFPSGWPHKLPLVH
jgi:hypothetical protein